MPLTFINTAGPLLVDFALTLGSLASGQSARRVAPVIGPWIAAIIVLVIVVVLARRWFGGARPRERPSRSITGADGRELGDTRPDASSGELESRAPRAPKFVPQGRRKVASGRGAPEIRARAARLPAPQIQTVYTAGGDAGHVPPRIAVDGVQCVNPTIFLIAHTRHSTGSRLWVRDAFQAYQAYAAKAGISAASAELFGRAATSLGWKRGKSCDRFYIDRMLILPESENSKPKGGPE